MNNSIPTNKGLRVIDFFCGAGGFSEGFRQQGFEIVMGVDKWQPAIDTHNLNHNLNDSVKDVLDFWGENSSDTVEIDNIPDTEFIIGSPSCVSFSMSNRAGKADKTHGIRLIEAYLRVIAVKKHQDKSVLVGWYMENVPKSRDYIKDEYSFADLNLTEWAKKNNKNPLEVVVSVKGGVFNAGDFGAPQERKRYIVGEWIRDNSFVPPLTTYEIHVKSKEVRSKMPKPNMIVANGNWCDPNYPKLVLKAQEITDHFYDTGIYKIDWEKAEHLKTNHPFMGRMSFPEDEDRTCRTIMATRSSSTREAIIYKSEYNRKGNGEYRLPTIREVASLMGFPYVYQFIGSEGIKWRQIGNAVCPHMGAALAKALRNKMGLCEMRLEKVDFSPLRNNHQRIDNLNSFYKKKFDNPTKRQQGARFRRHPFKLGNMTVDLMNYHPNKTDEVAKNWFVSVFWGTGKGHIVRVLEEKDLQEIEKLLQNNLSNFTFFVNSIRKEIYSDKDLQNAYESDLLLVDRNNPLNLVKKLAHIIKSCGYDEKYIEDANFFHKKYIPLPQLMAMYGLLNLIICKN